METNFEGTRIPVEIILDFLTQDYSSEQIIKEYPRLNKEDIISALKFATNRIKKKESILHHYEILIDENVPHSLISFLIENHHQVLDVKIANIIKLTMKNCQIFQ